MLSNVVGFVLAAMLLNVLGFDIYEDDDLDGEGDGGVLGGRGLMEASSSASAAVEGDQADSSSESDECLETASSSPLLLSEMALRWALRLLGARPGDGRGEVPFRLLSFLFIELGFPLDSWRCRSGRLPLVEPPSLRWSQLMMGLLDPLCIFFGTRGGGIDAVLICSCLGCGTAALPFNVSFFVSGLSLDEDSTVDTFGVRGLLIVRVSVVRTGGEVTRG